MSIKYDLHSHSTASDGTLTPRQLILAAKEAKIDVLALTDHDCLDGIADAAEEAKRQNLSLVVGVEISVTWNNTTIHMLGLGVDPDNAPLREGLATLCEFRQWRAEEIARKLDQAGIPGALEGAMAEASEGNLISRTHFARFLIKNGYAKDFRKVFKNFLVQGKPGHVSGDWAPLQDAIDWVNGAGGQAVIAHPARYKMTRTKLSKLLTEFKDAGGKGLEVVSSAHNSSECQNMAQLAVQHQLLASCGSDFHSPDTSWAQLGRIPELPAQCTPIWENWTTRLD